MTMTAPATTAGSAGTVAADTVKPSAGRMYKVRDTLTMLKRNLKAQQRDPVATIAIIGIPVLFLLLFVFVYGGALQGAVQQLGAASYVDYVLPGLIIMTAVGGLIGASTFTSVDMAEGIVDRFRTMAIYRPSILIARVASCVIQTIVSMAAVFGVAFLTGLSPTATLIEWIAIFGLLTGISFAFIWLGVAIGLASKSVATASNAPFPLILLPLVGSGIVPTDTMPTAVRYFAEYQPFTPMTETLRGLLQGTAIGNSGWITLAWCAAITVLGIWWSLKAFARERTR